MKDSFLLLYAITMLNIGAIALGVYILSEPLGWRVAIGIGLIAWSLLPIQNAQKNQH